MKTINIYVHFYLLVQIVYIVICPCMYIYNTMKKSGKYTQDLTTDRTLRKGIKTTQIGSFNVSRIRSLDYIRRVSWLIIDLQCFVDESVVLFILLLYYLSSFYSKLTKMHPVKFCQMGFKCILKYIVHI